MSDPTDSLPDDPATLKAMLLAERTRAERLAQIIKEMQRHRFGRRAETLPEGQLLLGFEEVEQTSASDEANQEATSPAERGRAPPSAGPIVAVCPATCHGSR
jgi:transposase